MRHPFQVLRDGLAAKKRARRDNLIVAAATLALMLSIPVVGALTRHTPADGYKLATAEPTLVGDSYPGVVRIGNTVQTFMGSGVWVSPTLIVTARHVVAGQSVVLVDGRPADLVAVDADNDIAVLQILDAPPHVFYHVAAPVLGEVADAREYFGEFANGDIFGTPIQTRGYVTTLTAHGRFVGYNGGIQPGMSGGPLFNLKGEVIGVTSHAIPWGNGMAAPNATMGFYAPGDAIQALIDSIKPTIPVLPFPSE